MQEEVLKLVLLALEDGSALSRKVLVMFVVQRLEPHFPQASKTSIGHVVQLLYRASCFKVRHIKKILIVFIFCLFIVKKKKNTFWTKISRIEYLIFFVQISLNVKLTFIHSIVNRHFLFCKRMEAMLK